MSIGLEIINSEGLSILDADHGTMGVYQYLEKADFTLHAQTYSERYVYRATISVPNINDAVIGSSCSNAFCCAYIRSGNTVELVMSAAIASTDVRVAVFVSTGGVSEGGNYGIVIKNEVNGVVFDSREDNVVDHTFVGMSRPVNFPSSSSHVIPESGGENKVFLGGTSNSVALGMISGDLVGRVYTTQMCIPAVFALDHSNLSNPFRQRPYFYCLKVVGETLSGRFIRGTMRQPSHMNTSYPRFMARGIVCVKVV